MKLDLKHTAVILLIWVSIVVASPHSQVTHSIRKRLWAQQNQQPSSQISHRESPGYFTLLRSLFKASSTPVRAPEKEIDHSSFRYAHNHPDTEEKLFAGLPSSHLDGSTNRPFARWKKLVAVKKIFGSGYLSTSSRDGLNFARCESATDCVDPRRCGKTVDSSFVPCSSGDICLCLPPEGQSFRCFTSGDCDRGELCTVDTSGKISATFCVSSTAMQTVPDWEVAGSGLNGDVCNSFDDCEGSRSCKQDADTLCSGGTGCYCFQSTSAACSATDDCDLGEVCSVGGDFENPLCLSALFVDLRPDIEPVNPLPSKAPPPNAPSDATPEANPTSDPFASPSTTPPTDPSAPSSASPPPSASPFASPPSGPGTSPPPSNNPEQNDGGVCIDARALEQFSSAQLVFEKHSLATVLCDKNESCATPGHMVKYQGAPMMMRTYCALAGCMKRVMHVNSPRYKRGLRVRSKSAGLEYTAFAARYETRGEEAVMQVALRMGL